MERQKLAAADKEDYLSAAEIKRSIAVLVTEKDSGYFPIKYSLYDEGID